MLRRTVVPLRILALLALIGLYGSTARRLNAQTLSSAFVYGGAAFGNALDEAGRFGVGIDFRITSHFDLGGEFGTIFKDGDVGAMGSGNVTYHFTTPRPRRQGWDPFLVGGISGARIFGTGGVYANLGAGLNYWLDHRWALRAEFKAYPGGQDLGDVAELRFGVTFPAVRSPCE